MQPYFDVDRAQERDSSPVIFGTYVEARATRPEVAGRELGARETPAAAELAGTGPLAAELANAGQLASGKRATVTPLPLFAASTAIDGAEREVKQGETRPLRETLASSVQLKLDVEPRAPNPQQASQRVDLVGDHLDGHAPRGFLASELRVDAEPITQTSSAHAATDSASAQEEAAAAARAAHDVRVAGAWREWLGALARDPEAALAAAQAYQQLDAAARDEWLSAVESDLAGLGVPAVAVYSPLLAVESDPQRTQMMRQRVARSRAVEPVPSVPRRALLGRLPNGVRLGVLVEPLYLQFVQVLACAYVPAQRFLWVRHDPIALDTQALNAGHELEGATLEAVHTRLLVDELARTVVSHRRLGGTLPDALCLFANLFGLEHMVGGGDELTLR